MQLLRYSEEHLFLQSAATPTMLPLFSATNLTGQEKLEQA
jgi:hypothetical protein